MSWGSVIYARGLLKQRISRFRNDKKEAWFWDTHDSTDYLHEFQDDPETVFVRPENGVVQLGTVVWQRLLREAKRRRTSPARLLDRWLREKLFNA